MRVKLIIILSMLVPVLVSAQSKKVKLRAFQQNVLPGVARTTISESGNVKQEPIKTSTNYFIYLENPASIEMDIQHIWLRGKLMGVRVENPKLPVILQNPTIPGKTPDTLARSVPGKVYQLVPLSTTDSLKLSSSAKKKIRSNEVVVHTIERGKNCYYELGKIKILDPVALQ